MKRLKSVFDLSKRKCRVLVYLLASVIINVTFLFARSVYSDYFFFYVNWFGVLLLFLFYGRPHMYGGWYDPTSILPPALLVFGFFVEMFVVCELVIYVKENVA